MKTVIEMAREAGLFESKIGTWSLPSLIVEELERFAALVREDERKEQALQRLSDIHQDIEREKQQEPVAWMWQHDETGRIGFVDVWQVEHGWQENNPRNILVKPVYTTPPTIEAAVLAAQGVICEYTNY